MANQKISVLTSLTGANIVVADDVLPIVDTSAVATKKVSVAELVKAAGLIPCVDSQVFDKASGKGIKVDLTTPTYPWRDLIGEIVVRGTGANDPTFDVYRGTLRQYSFGTSGVKECWNNFHIPHDHAPGTDIFVHAHWSCNVVPTGNVKWYFDVSYAKGHNQAAFPAPITTSIVQASSSTQYQHLIAEVQLSAASPTGSQISTNLLEPDGVLIVRTYRDAADAADTLNQAPFLHYVDVHYQSTGIGTKQKAPAFYT